MRVEGITKRECQECSKLIYSGKLCYSCWQEWANTDFVSEYYEVKNNEN